jgi:hypothetical protein
MRRREFITALGGTVAWPVAARAQQAGKVARIGFPGAVSSSEYASRIVAIRAGLRDLSYVEGMHFVMEFRWAEGNYQRLSELAADLVRSGVDVVGDAQRQMLAAGGFSPNSFARAREGANVRVRRDRRNSGPARSSAAPWLHGRTVGNLSLGFSAWILPWILPWWGPPMTMR